MYVLTTTQCATPGGVFAAGTVLEIPHEYYQPAGMSRLGSPLTSAMQAVLVTWASVCPGWPAINPE